MRFIYFEGFAQYEIQEYNFMIIIYIYNGSKKLIFEICYPSLEKIEQ